MVTITASYSVLPNEPTPNGLLWLSDFDQVAGPRHVPLLYIYKAKQHNHDAVERLRNSLSKILVRYYPIAGRLRRIEGGRLELDCNAKGVTLFEAETTKTLQDYGDFSGEHIKDFGPIVDYTKPIKELPLLLVQVTRFHGDEEAFAIGIAFCHFLSDGFGCIQFINSWAKMAREEILEPHEMPFLDRTILKFQHSPLPPRFDHLELKPYPLILGRSDNTIEKEKKTTGTLLKLTPEQVEKVKKKANDQSPKEGSRPYSRFESIAAHIWRCASKARELDENQPTLIRFNTDIRSRLIPPLPRNYFGNALTLTAATCHVGEIISNSLSFGAQKVREAIQVVKDEYIRSQIDVVRGQETLDKARALFFGGPNEGKDIQFSENPNLHITSWMSMPIYEANFGWGKPVYVGLGGGPTRDRALIIQNPDGDGSISVSMHFQIAHMQLFKKFFYEDILLEKSVILKDIKSHI